MSTRHRDKNRHHNTPWSRDELILALDLYMKHRHKTPSSDHQDVLETSSVLDRMATLMGKKFTWHYRTPEAIVIKLCKFIKFDAYRSEGGTFGMGGGSKDDELVWEQLHLDEVKLSNIAAAIRAAIDDGNATLFHSLDDDDYDIKQAAEGKILTRMHRVRERQKKLVEAKKRNIIKSGKRLSCEACEFNFEDNYGQESAGIIDVHHTKPLHKLRPNEETHIDDLAILCPNCHRVIHASKEWLSVENVRELIAIQKRNKQELTIPDK